MSEQTVTISTDEFEQRRNEAVELKRKLDNLQSAFDRQFSAAEQLAERVMQLEQQRNNLSDRCRVYQSAWDVIDLNKRLSSLDFKCAHGASFEEVYSEVTKQRDELLAALEPLRIKFQSGNHVPVERAVIKSNEWKPVEAAIASVKGGAA